MDGTELYQCLQKKYPQLPECVIFTTESVKSEDSMTFMKQSGRLFLPEPFTLNELKVIVGRTLKEMEND